MEESDVEGCGWRWVVVERNEKVGYAKSYSALRQERLREVKEEGAGSARARMT
jgi:hypothetical protein